MRFELFVAWRYLTARRREKFISLVGAISVFGVAVGVAALIVVLSVMAGFDNDLKEKIIGVNPHVLIENTQGMAEVDPAIDILKADSSVLAVEPYISGQAVLKTPFSTTGALIKGISVNAGSATQIKDYILQGGFPQAARQVVLGRELAKALGIGKDGRIDIISAFDGKRYSFTVSGIFACGMYDYDSSLAFIGIEDAQEIFGMPGIISGLGLKLKSAYKADEFAEALRGRLNYMYTVRTWADLNSNLFGALKLEKITMFLILTLIVIVAAFNIASTLILMVLEKTKDIGILKAQGATCGAIRLIFTLEGLIIGFTGTAIGLAMGFGLCGLLKKYQFVRLPKEIYYIDRLPVLAQYGDSLTIALAAILISLLATVYPAHQASRLDPVEALRYE